MVAGDTPGREAAQRHSAQRCCLQSRSPRLCPRPGGCCRRQLRTSPQTTAVPGSRCLRPCGAADCELPVPILVRRSLPSALPMQAAPAASPAVPEPSPACRADAAPEHGFPGRCKPGGRAAPPTCAARKCGQVNEAQVGAQLPGSPQMWEGDGLTAGCEPGHLLCGKALLLERAAGRAGAAPSQPLSTLLSPLGSEAWAAHRAAAPIRARRVQGSQQGILIQHGHGSWASS